MSKEKWHDDYTDHHVVLVRIRDIMDLLLTALLTFLVIGITCFYLSYRYDKQLCIVITFYLLVFNYIYFPRTSTKDFGYFAEQGIPGPKPLPFVGNMWGLWRQIVPIHDRKLVEKYGKVFGYFDGPQPKLWITDPDLIKAVFVQDFDHFVDRRVIILY